MADPINYALDVQQPFQAALQGYQVGTAIRANEQLLAQQQAAQAAQQQMQTDLARLAANPTPQGITQAVLKYPQLSEQFKRANDMLTTQQQQAQSKALMPIYFAAQSGNPQIAKQKLLERATSLENSGMAQDAKEYRDMAELIDLNPGSATVVLGGYLTHSLGPEKFIDNFGKLGAEQRAAEKAPSELRNSVAVADKAEADAKTAGVTAQFAHQNAIKDLEVKGWNVENIKSEIGYRKEANRIAAMNAAANKESNDLKRQELRLKIQEAEGKLAESARAKVADVESATSSMDNLINTVDRLKKNPGLKDVVGSLEGADWYPNQLAAASTVVSPYGLVASSGDDRADAIALIETLKSQAFLAMAPSLKGMGALSNAEGEKLQAGLQNLSRKQSEKQFNANLDEVQRLVLKARKNVETRYGVKAGPPDTPAVQSSPQQIDDLVNKYLNPKPPGAR